MAEGGGVVGTFHEGAVEMGEEFRAAAELHLRADVIAPLLTEGALTTGKADFQGDAVAHGVGGYLGADGCDDAGGFVAQAHGFAHHEVAIPPVGVVVQVGATETSGTNGDLDFTAGWRGERARFLASVRDVSEDRKSMRVGCGEALTRRRSLAPCRTRAWVVSVELTVMMDV